MDGNGIYLLYGEERVKPIDPNEDPWTIVDRNGEPIGWRVLVAIEGQDAQAHVFESRAQVEQWIADHDNDGRVAPVLNFVLPEGEPALAVPDGKIDDRLKILEHRITEVERWQDRADFLESQQRLQALSEKTGYAIDSEELFREATRRDPDAPPGSRTLFLYPQPMLRGVPFEVNRYYGDLRAAMPWWPPLSARSNGYTAMWPTRFPKATGATTKATVQAGEKTYDPLPFVPLAAESI